MRRVPWLISVLVLFAACSFAQRANRDPNKEKAIEDSLAAVAPQAVPTFHEATLAMNKEDYGQAAKLYDDVVKQAPWFSPALRRLALSLAGYGRRDEAIAFGQRAVKLERTPENLISLAEILALYDGKQQIPQSEQVQALALAREAMRDNHDVGDPGYAVAMAQIALRMDDQSAFHEALGILTSRFPNELSTHYYNAIQLAIDGKWIASEDEIKTAERLGLPESDAQGLLATGIHKRALFWHAVHTAGYLLVAWVCGLLLLFGAGKAFSKLTLSQIERADATVTVSGSESRLRRIYRLINVAGVYYYVSLPFVIVLVLALAGGVTYGFLVVGQVPIKLVVILVIGALVTVYKMIHSLFVRVKSEPPGRRLTREEAPDLWNVTNEVAQSLGTRPLDEIRVTPGTQMAVYETGSFTERRQDRGRRTLVMGLGLVPGFDQNGFRAVLAHEYGHLSHRDTAGGDVALRVTQDMQKFAIGMARAGQAVWWNLAFQFLRLYHFLFRRISHGATRLQEVLADRAAARLYGAEHFEDGLRHVVRRDIEFQHFASKELQEALNTGRAVSNLYELEVKEEKTVEDAIVSAITRPTSEDDTHPSPKDRFRLVSGISPQQPLGASSPVWDLFSNRDKLSKEMSLEIEANVRRANAT